MANSLTAFNPEYWSKRMQVIFFKEAVYRELASFEERSMLKDGDVVHRPYRSRLLVQTYTKGTAVTVQDVSSTDEYLTVDTTKVAPFYVDDIDKIQNKWDAANKFADDAGRDLNNWCDGAFLAEVTNATSDIDDGDVGGTATNAIVPTVTNVGKIFTAAAKKLDKLNIKRQDRYAVITPTILQLLVDKYDGKDTSFGDEVARNGKIGRYGGFNLYLSNSTYYSATWTPADNPTANDTITINGVTLTFVASPSSAGDIDIGAATANTIDNIVTLLNAPGTTTATGIALSAADQKLLEGITATDGTTTLGITMQGAGEVAVAASEAADLWSAETVHLMFGVKGAVDMVVQKEPGVEFKEVQDKLGKNVLPWVLYGKKTFAEGKDQLVDVKIDGAEL